MGGGRQQKNLIQTQEGLKWAVWFSYEGQGFWEEPNVPPRFGAPSISSGAKKLVPSVGKKKGLLGIKLPTPWEGVGHGREKNNVTEKQADFI